jgi:hypothetical protein
MVYKKIKMRCSMQPILVCYNLTVIILLKLSEIYFYILFGERLYSKFVCLGPYEALFYSWYWFTESKRLFLSNSITVSWKAQVLAKDPFYLDDLANFFTLQRRCAVQLPKHSSMLKQQSIINSFRLKKLWGPHWVIILKPVLVDILTLKSFNYNAWCYFTKDLQ